nr:hypothetical protein [Tanacetum cinerariifolium]
AKFSTTLFGKDSRNSKFKSSYKSNVSGNICGKFLIDKSNMVDSSDMLGGEFLEPGRSISQVDLHSQVFERVKYAISNETQGVKNKASLIDQEKACQSSTSFLPQQLCSSIQVMQPSQNFHVPNSPSIPSTSFNQNLCLAGDFSLFTKANPQSTSCTLKSKSNKAPECYAICSKALRFAKMVQDKKYISKNKEWDAGRMPSRIKKKCKDKARKNNNVHVGEDDHSCSMSQEDSEDDESDSMFSLGASLGITLDGKPARSKNDTFSDFLLEEVNTSSKNNIFLQLSKRFTYLKVESIQGRTKRGKMEGYHPELRKRYSLGASLSITLDRNPARSNNDVFSEFLLEVKNNHIPPPPL